MNSNLLHDGAWLHLKNTTPTKFKRYTKELFTKVHTHSQWGHTPRYETLLLFIFFFLYSVIPSSSSSFCPYIPEFMPHKMHDTESSHKFCILTLCHPQNATRLIPLLQQYSLFPHRLRKKPIPFNYQYFWRLDAFVHPVQTYLRVTYRKKKVVWDAIYFSAHGVFLELGGWYERRAGFRRVWVFDGRDVGENVWSFIYILTSCDPNACILPFSQRSFVHELDNYLCTANKWLFI